MIRKAFNKSLISMLAIALLLAMSSFQAIAAEGDDPAGGDEQTMAKRTILLYDCGSDLETEAGLASYNLRQILRANFSADDDVRVIVMTGGADKWHMTEDELVFPEDVYVPDDAVCEKDSREPLDPNNPDQLLEPKSSISNTYNQIWEAKGADAPENAGKMVLLDGDGVLGDGENAKRSIIDVSGGEYVDGKWEYDYDNSDANYEWMIDPEVLKAFINYGVDIAPAEKYDLILWDHGMGPDTGFCSDLHESGHGFDSMGIDKLADAFAHNKVVDPNEDGTPDSRFDFINFDACLMNSVEIDLVFSEFTDYYIASPEYEPGYGQEYEGWLNMVGANPDVDTMELGKKIVDDFVAFYDKEEGDGSSQEGTLAVIDMNELMNTRVTTAGASDRGFVEALRDLNYFMQTEVAQEALYYDEFRSFKSSLKYGEDKMYDLGTLISQLSFVYDEADYEDLREDGSINDQNIYSDTAEALLSIMNDDDIIYARGTKGIRTKEQFYRGADGKVHIGTQGTSGMYICFTPLDSPTDPMTHYTFMNQIIRTMDENDPRALYFKELQTTSHYYGLIYYTGIAVTEMVTAGTDKDTIDYDALKAYWQANTDKWGAPLWGGVEPFIEALGGEDTVKEWLAPIIRQQRDEGIIKDQIKAKTFKTDAGTGCKVTLNDIKKQAISDITMNVVAELPAVDEFMNSGEHEDYLIYNSCYELPSDLTIGRISGEEIFDIDPLKDGYNKVVDWLFDNKSEWKLDPPPTKWHALKDAAGTIHAASPLISEKEMDIPTGYFTKEMVPEYDEEGQEFLKEMEVCNVAYLVYLKDEGDSWKLEEIYFRDERGGGRTIPVSEYQGTLELTPLIRVTDDWVTFFLPISQQSFTLSPETINDIELKYMDIDDIPDIADTDGDGRSMHSTVTVNNIYGQHVDITDIVNNPESAAEQVENDANALPTNVTVEDKETIEAVRAEYEALTDEEKASLPDSVELKIQVAEAKLAAAVAQAKAEAAEAKAVEAAETAAAAQAAAEAAQTDAVAAREEAAAAQEAAEEARAEAEAAKAEAARAKADAEAAQEAAEAAQQSQSGSENASAKSDLAATIVDAATSGITASKYTKASYDRYIKAFNDARTILRKTDATANEYKAAETALAEAQKALVKKAANTLKVKAKKLKVKAKSLKKKAKSFSAKKAFTVSKAVGKVAYKKVKGNGKIKVAANGKIKIKKGLKKGTYKIKVKVTAAGNTNTLPATKIVTVKVKVK